jgi:hypothetical protein
MYHTIFWPRSLRAAVLVQSDGIVLLPIIFQLRPFGHNDGLLDHGVVNVPLVDVDAVLEIGQLLIDALYSLVVRAVHLAIEETKRVDFAVCEWVGHVYTLGAIFGP